jgi:membrane-associated protein
MLRNLPAWQKNTLRLIAWTALATLVWALWQDCALAQGQVGTAEPEGQDDGGISGFLASVCTAIFRFDTNGLMETLSKPQFAIPAFIILNVIVFVETGLLIGFFLPGDSLLVITGLICANPSCTWSLPLLLITLSLSAITGDTVGYWIGFKTGPKIFNREKSLFFDKDHLLKAQQFYEKYGGKTIVLARFMPFLRTFAPVVAGVGKMDYKQFLTYNIFGGIAWVVSMVLAGRFLPQVIDPVLLRIFDKPVHVAEHIEAVVILVVLASVTPMIYAWLKGKLAAKPSAPAPQHGEVAMSAK